LTLDAGIDVRPSEVVIAPLGCGGAFGWMTAKKPESALCEPALFVAVT
jgi:hypothetical protein